MKSKGKVRWSNYRLGSVPENALIGGFTPTCEPLYIGRNKFEGGVAVGKIKEKKGTIVEFSMGNVITCPLNQILTEIVD